MNYYTWFLKNYSDRSDPLYLNKRALKEHWVSSYAQIKKVKYKILVIPFMINNQPVKIK